MTRGFSADPWLAETLGQPAFKLAERSTSVSERRLSAEMAELAKQGNAFFFAKVPTTDVARCMELARAGFSVVDVGITFALAAEGGAPPPDVAVRVPSSAEQHEAVANIAGRCFRWSRFHLDPRIPVDRANLIKRRWAENYCRGQRGAGLYVGEVGGRVAGFLAVLESAVDGRKAAIIDLIGVSPEHQGRGVGTALVRRFTQDWQAHAAELRVGTQAANVQSMRFYENNGFRIIESTYVMHAHFRDGVPIGHGAGP
jgi:dTDP-4-amino-4,6-dideoxy-D-galactose acyltransferase